MKKLIVHLFLLVCLMQTALLNIAPAMAGYTCSWLGFGRNDTSYSASYQTCDAVFEVCDAGRIALPTLSSCESDCWPIGRWNWCETYEGCVANIDQVEPGSGEENYMRCIETCRDATYETPPDCIGELKKCCLDAYNELSLNDGADDEYDTSDTEDLADTDAGTYCPEGYVSEDGVCVAAEEEPAGDYEIFVDPGDFTIPADGISQQSVTAHVRDQNGAAAGYPVWIELYNPNDINPGTLEIETGNEGAGDTSVRAVYTAPEIKSGQKVSPQDEIKDLIYVFAEIDGETSYKVINAVLQTQAEGFIVDITIEKKGFKTKTLQASFDKGALSGNPVLKIGKNAVPVNKARVTVKGNLPDREKTEINLSKTTENGSFWFERLGEEGENNIGEIEMELDDEAGGYYQKGQRYGESLILNAGLSGMSKAPGQNYLDDLDRLAAMLADRDEKDALNIVGAIKMTAYGLYFTEYYSEKAYESMQNYREYMTNILKDTIGFVTGIWNITGGMFNAADNKSGALGKFVVGWAGKESKNSFASAFKGAFNMVTAQLRKGIAMDTAANKHYMGYLSEFLGGLEGALTNELVNNADDASKQIKNRFDAYLKRVYYRDITGVLEKFKVDPDNLPDNLDARIKTAEAIFKINTEAHDRRNAIQYEWDYDTALLTEFVNVSKPFAKIYLMTQYPDAVTVSNAVDMAGHAFNALKVAAGVNHVLEWNALYYDDVISLYSSLAVLYNGQVTISDDGGVRVIMARAGGESFDPSRIAVDSREAVDLVGAPFDLARAAEPADKTSAPLNAVASSFEKGDAQNLASQLEVLSKAREMQMEEAAKAVAEISEGISYLQGEEIELALDAQARLGAMEMEDYLMDMRLLSLAADESAENTASFKKAVEEYSLERGQTLEKTGRVLDNIDRAEKDALSESAGKNNLLNLSVMTYAILAVGAVVLLFGLIMGIILLVKKKTVAGLAVVAVAVSAGIMAGAFGYDAMQKTEPSGDDVPSIPGFGEFDEELILDEDGAGLENPREEGEDAGDGGLDGDEVADDGNVEETGTGAGADADADAGAVDGSESPDTVADAVAPLSDPGRIYNEEFGYSLEIGEEFVEGMNQFPTDDPFYEGSVVYCYDLNDETYEDWSCGAGMVNVFMIAILNDDQYEEEKASPFYDPDYDMGVHDGLHYIFSHPNGDFPEEVLPLVRAYGDIAASIEFFSPAGMEI